MESSRPSHDHSMTTANAATPKKRNRFDTPSPIPNVGHSVSVPMETRTVSPEAQDGYDANQLTRPGITIDPGHVTSSPFASRNGDPAHRVANENNRVESHPTPPNSGAKMASQQGTLQEPCTDDLVGNSHKVPVPHALELCNVGLMVSVLQKEMKKDSSMAFVPYSPVESDIDVPCYTLPPSISEIEHNRVNDFYEELEELLDSMSSYINPGDTTFSYSRRKMVNFNKYSSVPHKVMTEYDVLHKRESMYRDHSLGTYKHTPNLSNTQRMLSHMFSSIKNAVAADHAGLGSINVRPAEDAFESFRKKRATQYHENIAIKASVRKDTSVMILSSQSSCYKCNQQGHHAKDCRYFPT
ncbi:hypothetical protein X943_001496 [Babesia divergens]|uniref:CCHC-type domain-containing protein n=1 Tax=Babesia divergens TaxID=32595 RepID=A0AAD9GCY5_BABDI|nr:hypothetical protein X943_001496 [Babesia divergens]